MVKIKFGDKLKVLREKSGISKDEIANKLNVTNEIIIRWENNEIIPETDIVIRIGKIFEVSLDYLLNDEYKNSELEEEKQDKIYVNKETFENYINCKKKEGIKIAIGVGILILSCIFPLALKENIGTILFLVTSIIGVAIFIILGFEEKEYRILEENYLIIDKALINEIKEKHKRTKKKCAWLIILGISIIVIGIIIPTIINEGLIMENESYYSIFIVSVAIAVYMFIRAGYTLSSYDSILNNKDNVKEAYKSEWYYEFTMSLATFIFLGIGFIWDAWHPAWIIFPITALLTEGYIKYKNEKK